MVMRMVWMVMMLQSVGMMRHAARSGTVGTRGIVHIAVHLV